MLLITQIRFITKTVYRKKIFYWILIKISFIKKSFLFVFIFFSFYSCSPIVYNNDVDIKVIKTGTLDFNSSYTFILPQESYLSYTLTYNSIINIVSKKLQNLGFVFTNNAKNAKYALLIKINNYPNININAFDIKVDKLSLNEKDVSLLKLPRKFSLDVYLVNKNNKYTKVMEGTAEEVIHTKVNLLNQEKGLLNFVECSIDALFDKNVVNKPECIDYYYKCWP